MNFDLLKAAEPTLSLVKGTEAQVNPQTISAAGKPRENSFVFIKNKKFFRQLLEAAQDMAKLGGVFEASFHASLSEDEATAALRTLDWLATVESVDQSMVSLSKLFYDEKFADLNYHVDGRQLGSAQVHPDAEIAQNVFIGEGAVIGKDATIMPGCVLMPHVFIGEGTTLFPNVTLYPYTVIGKNCRIHANTVIGADGFGYNFLQGEHQKIWHFGGVEIRDNVEIGASAAVDAGAFSPTFIDSGVKLDNFAQIAHNNHIGKHSLLCGRAGLAGSVTLEDYVVIGAAGGCAPGATLKKGTQVAAMAVVSENAVWGPGETVAGHPARPLKEWLKTQARLNKLAKEYGNNKK